MPSKNAPTEIVDKLTARDLPAHAGRGFEGDHIVTDRGEPRGVAAGARPDVEYNEIRAARDKRRALCHGVGWHGLKTRGPNGGLRTV
jgi:hypothetical protein